MALLTLCKFKSFSITTVFFTQNLNVLVSSIDTTWTTMNELSCKTLKTSFSLQITLGYSKMCVNANNCMYTQRKCFNKMLKLLSLVFFKVKSSLNKSSRNSRISLPIALISLISQISFLSLTSTTVVLSTSTIYNSSSNRKDAQSTTETSQRY